MNILVKVSEMVVSLVAVGVLSGCSSSATRVTEALPRTAEVTDAAGRLIAADLSKQLGAVKFAPRKARTIQTASVEISEMIEVVVVEASRLPANERLVDAAVAKNVGL